MCAFHTTSNKKQELSDNSFNFLFLFRDNFWLSYYWPAFNFEVGIIFAYQCFIFKNATPPDHFSRLNGIPDIKIHWIEDRTGCPTETLHLRKSAVSKVQICNKRLFL